jgi:uroporphyrinogen-III synthase
VIAGYINYQYSVTVPKGEALEVLTQCYASELQYSTEHNATEIQKVTYKGFTKITISSPSCVQTLVSYSHSHLKFFKTFKVFKVLKNTTCFGQYGHPQVLKYF